MFIFYKGFVEKKSRLQYNQIRTTGQLCCNNSCFRTRLTLPKPSFLPQTPPIPLPFMFQDKINPASTLLPPSTPPQPRFLTPKLKIKKGDFQNQSKILNKNYFISLHKSLNMYKKITLFSLHENRWLCTMYSIFITLYIYI